MKKSGIIVLLLGLAVILISLVFQINLTSATTVTTTDINSTLTEVTIVNATGIYSYEINFIDTATTSSAKFTDALGAGTTRGNTTTTETATAGNWNELSVYESKLDSTRTGVDLNDNIVFNVTHTGTITLRQGIFVYANESEQTINFCSETALCYEWSECSNGIQTRTCTYPVCKYDNAVETKSCSTGSGSSGGGGGGGTSRIGLKVSFQNPIIKDNGETEIPVTIENAGDMDLDTIKVSAALFKDGALVSDANIRLDKNKFDSIARSSTKSLTVTATIKSSDKASFYEIVVYVESESPSYNISNKLLFTSVGKSAAEVLKIVAFTDGLIGEHPECGELSSMIEEAQQEYKNGNTKEALDKANKAIEACKKYLKSPLKPIISQRSYDNIPLYLGIGVIAALAFGIIFNIYKHFRFRKRK